MSFQVVPLLPDTEMDHYKGYAKLYSRLIDTTIDVDQTASEVKEARIEKNKEFKSRGISYPKNLFVVYSKTEAIGYGHFQPNLDKNLNEFESHAYAVIYTETQNIVLEQFIHKKLIEYAQELPGLEVIFYFVESDHDIDNYIARGGELVEKGYEYILNLQNINRSRVVQLANLDGLEVEILDTLENDTLEPFLQVYNKSKAEEPQGKSTREFHPVTLEDMVEAFSNINYRNIVALACFNGQPAGISHFGLIENRKFVYQRMTGVDPALWGKGIGTAIKAQCVLWIQEKYPDYLYVLTEVLDENLSMKKVNEKLGFQPDVMQVTIEFTLK